MNLIMNTTMNTLSVGDVTPQIVFSWMDYSMFVIMLSISVLIGVYYGFFAKKQDTINEYLFGGKTMKIFPVSMSIIASDTSGIALLAVPTDIYINGAAYCWTSIAYIVNGILCSYVFMPVFLKLQISTIFEYLNMRFNNKIRRLASFLYVLSVVIYNPMVIYIPSLAFAQATGMNLYFITIMVSIVCIFYTTIGGLKGVVWTDTIQTLSILGSMTVVFLLGITSVGGFSQIWEKASEGHRLDIFNFEVDFIRRDSFWALAVGAISSATSHYAFSQANVQRFKSVPSLTHARKVILISCTGIILIKYSGTLTGLIMFAKYSDCDPISTKQVTKDDQLLPHFVMDVAGHIKGLPGLFIAGIVCAGLSTLSTTLNTIAGTIYEDFIFPFMPINTTQKRSSNILKLLVVGFGILNILLALVVEQLGAILPLSVSIGAITGSPLVGLFILGMLCPIANSKGVLTAGITGLVFCSFMIFGNQYYRSIGLVEDFAKPISVDGCDFFVNTTLKNISPVLEKPFFLFRINFWFHNLIGVIITVSVGLIISWITRKQDDPPVDRKLLSPVVHFLLPKEDSCDRSVEYFGVEKAMDLVNRNSDNKFS